MKAASIRRGSGCAGMEPSPPTTCIAPNLLCSACVRLGMGLGSGSGLGVGVGVGVELRSALRLGFGFGLGLGFGFGLGRVHRQRLQRLPARRVQRGGLGEQGHHAGLQAVCARRGARVRGAEACPGPAGPRFERRLGVHCLAEASCSSIRDAREKSDSGGSARPPPRWRASAMRSSIIALIVRTSWW